MSGSHVRDKDGVNAVLLLCEAAAWHAARGQTLLEALNTLYEEFGVYRNVLRTKEFCGPDGMAAMQRLMDRLRSEPPQTMGGFTVEKMLDYTKEGTGVPKANVLEFRLSDNAKIIIRPSGTEPVSYTHLSVWRAFPLQTRCGICWSRMRPHTSRAGKSKNAGHLSFLRRREKNTGWSCICKAVVSAWM